LLERIEDRQGFSWFAAANFYEQALPLSPEGVPSLKTNRQAIAFVVEQKLRSENAMAASTPAVQENQEQVRFLEQEIECPRCHDSMTLCSDFDNLYYICEECDFCLYTIKK
jgi:hypothetical protein